MSQGHQPAVPLEPRPGNGHVLGFGCFPGLERKQPPPRFFVSHGQTRVLPVGLGEARPCARVHSVLCLAALLKCSLHWCWQSPGCVQPSPWDQSWGPRDWPGLRVQALAGSCSFALSSTVPLPVYLVQAIRFQGCLGVEGHCGEDETAGLGKPQSSLLALPLTLHLHLGRSRAVIPAVLGHRPSFVCLGGAGAAMTAANTALRSGSSSR